jgi:L-lactate dehydrogenase (cytochrome)
MIALGANFVLMGRAFYYALAAIGPEGAEHVMQLLKAELVCTMGQLGCVSLDELPDRLSVS